MKVRVGAGTNGFGSTTLALMSAEGLNAQLKQVKEMRTVKKKNYTIVELANLPHSWTREMIGKSTC